MGGSALIIVLAGTPSVISDRTIIRLRLLVVLSREAAAACNVTCEASLVVFLAGRLMFRAVNLLNVDRDPLMLSVKLDVSGVGVREALLVEVFQFPKARV